MLVECNHCGAPLDVRESVRFLKCQYCGTADERIQLRTVAQSTPADFRPPPRWRPPEHVAADSSVELPYRESRLGGVIAALIVTSIVVGLVIAIVVTQSGKPGGFSIMGTTLGGRELAALSIAQTPAALASSVSTSPSEKSVFAEIDSDRFVQLNFSYEEGHLDSPRSFYFGAKAGAHLNPAVRTALETKLASPLEESGSWRWEQVGLNVDLNTGSIGGDVAAVSSDNEPNPLWKRQLQALFQIVVSATFNQDVGPTEAEAKELLGTGYPFSSLAKLDPKTPVQSARDRIGELFPGSVFTNGGTNAHVAFDHPMFTHAEIEWKNEQNAPIYSVGLRPRLGPNGYAARREALATCLTKDFGKPEVNVTDYLKGQKYYYFEPKNARLYVNDNYFYFFADVPMDQTLWTRLLASIDGCR